MSSMKAQDCEGFMREALALAERGRWRTAPNPTVGAVLVKDGVVVARGWHTGFGEAHAEVACLRDAAAHGIDPAGCSLVVTLEPCNHHGKTPPCTEAILTAGIRHVVVGMADVNLSAAGGAARLREAGVRVDMGVLEQECRDGVADFVVWQKTSRPYVILKMAATLDGHTATRAGRAERITNEASRKAVMALRKGVGLAGGAVLVGGHTFTQDDPRLTARTDGATRQPLGVVATSRLPEADAPAFLLRERAKECVFLTTPAQAASSGADALRARGVRVHGVAPRPSGCGLDAGRMLECLRQEENCLYVLAEGGARMALSLLEGGLVDEFHLHLAPLVLGDETAQPLFAGRRLSCMAESLPLRLVDMREADGDCHLIFRPRR